MPNSAAIRRLIPLYAAIAAALVLAFAMPARSEEAPATAEASAEADAGAALTGDPKKGKRVFNRCIGCHTIDEGKPGRVGPNLYAIIGADFGHDPNYTLYSDNLLEMKAEGAKWTVENLDAYLKQPKDVIPKGIMSFPGLPKDEDRANIIAYMATFGGPLAEPAAE